MLKSTFRTFATAAALLGALAAPVLAGAPLADAFAMLSLGERQAVQNELRIGGFYAGAIDGAWGPGTARAVSESVAYIAENSSGAVRPDVSSLAAARTYLRGLGSARYSAWLYGEGGECDGCPAE